MLEKDLQEQLQTLFVHIKKPVQLIAFVDQAPLSGELLTFLNDVAEHSGLLETRVAESVPSGERTPSFAVFADGEDTGIRFAGIPGGHEFSSLILAILQAGGHPPKVEAATIKRIQALSADLHFETYVALSCHSCPEVVQALNLMAVLNPRIRHTMIDGAHFQAEVERRQVLSVPAIWLNGEPFSQGRQDLDEILAVVDSAGADEAAAKLSALEPFEVLVIGGGPAGAAAAIYAARKGIRTAIVAERPGGQVLDTLAIENFISVPSTQGPQLAAALETHLQEYDIEIIRSQRVSALQPAANAGELAQLTLASGASLQARAIIIATGASWREMKVPGEDEYKTRGVAFCPHCDGPMFKGRDVAVIGGGNSGIEAAIDLAGIASHVTVLEFADSLRADAVLQQKLHSLPNVSVHCNAQTSEVLGDGKQVTGLRYLDRSNQQTQQIELAGIFVQIGLSPNTAWLEGAVERNKAGEIITNDKGQTSAHGIFAAGDCTTVPYKQIIIAMGEGAKAALGAFDYLIRNSAP